MRRIEIGSSWDLATALKKRRYQARRLGAQVHSKKQAGDYEFYLFGGGVSPSRSSATHNDVSTDETNLIRNVIVTPGRKFPHTKGRRVINFKKAIPERIDKYGASSLLVTAIRNVKSLAMKASYKAPREEYYRGTVKAVKENHVIVTVSSRENWDRWDARIPLEFFDQTPEEGQEISCTININGRKIDGHAQILSEKSSSTLEDYNIDKEELLTWASKIKL